MVRILWRAWGSNDNAFAFPITLPVTLSSSFPIAFFAFSVTFLDAIVCDDAFLAGLTIVIVLGLALALAFTFTLRR